MSRNLVKPFFARPPAEYDQKYMSDLVQSFALYLEQMQNPGEGRHTRLTLTNLPLSDQGLEVGGLFHAAGTMGVVRIATSNQTNLLGTSGTGGVGTVTVVIS
jgi:hypothetical protein